MSDEIITRFAPSPSGNLHLGGARTALYSFLYARQNNGKFILRIEDTDKQRSHDEFIENIKDSMKWLNLHWDSEIVFQSNNAKLYEEAVNNLLESGKAYKCYCTEEEIEKEREAAISSGKPYRYSGKCRELSGQNPDKPYTIRFRLPDQENVVFHDIIRGKITTPLEALDDFIIARSDGSAVYNLAVVVDDIGCKITHVIRGDDHINNTPKQVLLFQALEKKVPKYAHLPLILGKDKKRLSKRHGALSVLEYKKQGIIWQAMMNFLARIGWSHGNQEIFSPDELLKKFSLKKVGSSPGVYDYEKLLWINQEHFKKMDNPSIAAIVKEHLKIIYPDNPFIDNKPLEIIVDGLKRRCHTGLEIAEKSYYFFHEKIEIDRDLQDKFWTADFISHMKNYIAVLSECKDFTASSIEAITNGYLENGGIQLKDIAQGLRITLTGQKVTPGLFELMEGIGKDWTISRIQAAINSMK